MSSSGLSSGAEGTEDVDLGGGTIEVFSGRVATHRAQGTNIGWIRIVDGPEYGNVTVNPDNTQALVLTQTNYTGALPFSCEVIDGDGASELLDASLNAVPGPIGGGWGGGNFHILNEDQNRELVIEHADNHRDTYVSRCDDALTLADITALEGLSVDDVNIECIVNNPDCGSSPDKVLAADAGSKLWRGLAMETKSNPASHWAHFEAGYDYDFKNFGLCVDEGSKFHPIYFTSCREGKAN